MMHFIRNVWRLGVKELRSFFADPILLILVIYIFTIAVYSVATGAKTEVVNAAIAVVDEDHSPLSREIAAALLPPYFQQARQIDAEEAITGMNKNEFVFVIDIPPNFERDLLRGDKPSIQVSADATAMSLAGIGVNYVSSIISQEISTLLREHGVSSNQPINLVSRYLFNPNAESLRYTSVMQVINNVSMLAIILAGAALIRERERGTVEHLLVMPVSAAEIMVAKIWANGLVILIGALISLVLVVQTILGIPIAGSLTLFAVGIAIYLTAATGLGIMLATFASTMPQFALLAIPVLIIFELLSGSATPMESMPVWLQDVMQLSPSTHFVSYAQAILYRGAGLSIVWPKLVMMGAISVAFFVIALARFRKALLNG
ncbi:ABC transporter permease [Parvibaculum sp. MBR-TMA-1.3b-4.2]|jgi:ABC-2 type transport system permease protein